MNRQFIIIAGRAKLSASLDAQSLPSETLQRAFIVGNASQKSIMPWPAVSKAGNGNGGHDLDGHLFDLFTIFDSIRTSS
jgi:hypothetical protein